LRRAWDFKSKKVPTQAELEFVLPLVGWDKVQWGGGKVQLTREGMELDLGGIGKEYAVDRACGMLLSAGVTSALVNLGGDVRVIGAQADGGSWRVGIAHPREQGATIATVELRGGAVATSGDYERFFEVDGKRYSHILNPRTGFPVQGFQSVSVVADSCLIAGTASTVAMLLGKKGGKGFLKRLGLRSVVVEETGAVVSFN
jgi:thiamine biosynthesis lipoprotein